MRRISTVVGCLVLAGTVLLPADLFAQHSVNFLIGGFVPKKEDTRINGDVPLNDLDFFAFDLGKFNSGTLGGEWLIGYGDRSEFGIGISFSSETVPSRYRDLVNENGFEIQQDLKLRIIPLTFSYRFLPAGRRAPVQPYLGVGLGVLTWRYTETGEFVDPDGFIFRDRFVASGTNFGPVYLGGVRVPVGGWGIGGEVRYQSANGEADPAAFAGGTKVDLGGFSYLATVTIAF